MVGRTKRRRSPVRPDECTHTRSATPSRIRSSPRRSVPPQDDELGPGGVPDERSAVGRGGGNGGAASRRYSRSAEDGSAAPARAEFCRPRCLCVPYPTSQTSARALRKAGQRSDALPLGLAAEAVPKREHPPEEVQARALAPAVGLTFAGRSPCPLPSVTEHCKRQVHARGHDGYALHARSVSRPTAFATGAPGSPFACGAPADYRPSPPPPLESR